MRLLFMHFLKGKASLILNALCQGLHAHLASRLSDKLHVQETRLLSIFMGPHEVNNMLKLGLLCLSNIQKQKTNENLNKWKTQKLMKKQYIKIYENSQTTLWLHMVSQKSIQFYEKKIYIKNSNENYIIKIQIYKICLPYHLQ